MRTEIFRVVGVTFVPGYPDNLHRLREAMDSPLAEVTGPNGSEMVRRPPGEGPAVVLEREPNNPHDRNAIAVHVPAVGMIGHVPRKLAARWAPRLDAGAKPRAWVNFVPVTPGQEDKPGIDVKLQWPDARDRAEDHRAAGTSERSDAVNRSIARAADDAGVAWAPGHEPIMPDDVRTAGFATEDEARAAWEAWQDEAAARGSW